MIDPEDGMYLAKREAEGDAMVQFAEREPFPSDERPVSADDVDDLLEKYVTLHPHQWVYALALATERKIVPPEKPWRTPVTVGYAPHEIAREMFGECIWTQSDASAVEAMLKEAAQWKGA